MAAVLTGIALHGGLLPFGATFLSFSDYMRPAIRLAALSKARVIYIWTHDSIALGEDGPTHQPVEQLAGLRAMPNMIVVRPSDATETVEAWRVALTHTEGPVGLVLTRQKLPVIDRKLSPQRPDSHKGAYILADAASIGARRDPDRDGIRSIDCARGSRAAHERRDPQPGRVDALLGAVRRAAAVLPRHGPPAERSRPREHRSGLAVRLGALRRPGRRDHRRQPFWRVGPGTHRHARVRLHTRAHRRDGESGTETDRLLVRMQMPKAFKRGDLVEWNSEAGRVRGVIVKKLVSNIRLNGLCAPRLEGRTAIRHQERQDGPCGHSQRTGAETRAARKSDD